MAPTYTNSVVSTDRVETNERTDERTLPVDSPSRLLTWSIKFVVGPTDIVTSGVAMV